MNRATWDVDERVRFRTNRPAVELWDAQTGEIRVRLTSKRTDDGISVRVALPALNSIFVVLRDRPTPKVQPLRKPLMAKSGPAKSKIVVSGPWELSFPEGWGAPETLALDTLQSWTDVDHPDVKAFSGVATYRTTFDVPKETAARETGRARPRIGQGTV